MHLAEDPEDVRRNAIANLFLLPPAPTESEDGTAYVRLTSSIPDLFSYSDAFILRSFTALLAAMAGFVLTRFPERDSTSVIPRYRGYICLGLRAAYLGEPRSYYPAFPHLSYARTDQVSCPSCLLSVIVNPSEPTFQLCRP